MTWNLEKSGGLASLLIAAIYLLGFGVFFLALDQTGYEGLSGRLAFALDNSGAITFAMIALYLICGAALIVVVMALHDRLRPTSPGASLVAACFGVAWSTVLLASGMISIIGLQSVSEIAATDVEAAAIVWAAVGTIQNGLGGGIEFIGGAWSIIIGVIALRTRALSRPLSWLGIALGVVGIATALPQSRDLTAVFGLVQIVWFIWLGYALLRSENA